jgi:carnitine 3-dehydrogenase
LRALEERLYQDSGSAARAAVADASGIEAGKPLRLVDTYVRPEWVDYNGHMSDSRYLQVFGDATDALFRAVGVDDAYRDSGRALYTVETHVTHSSEATALEPLYVTTQILGLDDKRIHLFHSLHRRRDARLIATGEQLYLHVTRAAAKASPMDGTVRARLEKFRAAHASIAEPARSARHLSLSRS